MKKPVKLLHVLPSLDQRYGGPLAVVLDLSARAACHGLHSEILGFGQIRINDNPIAPELLHALPTALPHAYCYSPNLRSWLSVNLKRFDGVVLHGMWLYPNWIIYRESARLGIPYACFPHGMLAPWPVFGQGKATAFKKKAYWLLREKSIFAQSVAVLFTTKREADDAAATFVLPSVPATVIPYGISVSRETVPSPGDPALTIPSDRKVALFLGRIHPKKNPHFLLEAWAQAAPPGEWLLVIAGPGDPSYVDDLQKLAIRLGIAQQVRFTGMVTGRNKSYLFQRSKWFLLPSQQENFGNAVLEAIGHDCAPVVSDQVYISEFFTESAEVLPLTRQAWVEFLSCRMLDEGRRKAILSANEQWLKPKFDIDNIAANWAKTLNRIFG